MANNNVPSESDHLTDLERAVCYYTLPKVTAPLTFGLIVAYTLCLIEAAAALTYGFVSGSDVWTRWGAICLAGIVLFGIFAFLARALLNDVKQRRMLATAQSASEVAGGQEMDLPNPFADHVLLRYPRHATSESFEITDNTGACRYTVHREGHRRTFRVSAPDGRDLARIEVRSWGGGFWYAPGTPGFLRVCRGNAEVARVRRRFGFAATRAVIERLEPRTEPLVAVGRSLYKGDRLVGRIYYLRRYLYLDVHKDDLDDGILGFFVAMA